MKQKLKQLICDDRLWILLLIAIIILPILYFFSLIGYDPLHEGFMFKTAYDVANGQTLFRESFTAYGAMAVYVQALFMKIFGNTIAAMNLSSCVALCAVYYVFYLIIRKMANKYIAFFGFIVMALCDYVFKDIFHPWSSIYALLALAISFWAWVYYIDTERNRYLYISGVAAAFSFWGRQPVGIVVLLSYILIILIYSIFLKPIGWKRACLFFGSYLGVHIAFITLIASQNAIEEFYTQVILGMFGFNSKKNEGFTVGESFQNLLSCLFPQGRLIWSMLPLFLLLTFAVLSISLIIHNVRKQVNKKQVIAIISLIIVSIASWHQYYPVNDSRHIFWAAIPMIACFSITLSEIFQCLSSGNVLKWTLGTIVVFCICFLPECSGNIRQGIIKYNSRGELYNNDEFSFLNGKYLSDDEAEYHNELYENIKELKEKYADCNIVNMTSMGEYSCFSQYNFHPEAFYCAVMPYNFYENVRDYVNEELPIIICYENDFGYWGYAGYEEYVSIAGNDSNYYWDSGPLGIYVPMGTEKKSILQEMKSDANIKKEGQDILLEASDNIYYGTHYYLKDAYEYEIEIDVTLDEESICHLAVYSDWHSKLQIEKPLTNGFNIIQLEGGWDNATLYISGVAGTSKIKEINLSVYSMKE